MDPISMEAFEEFPHISLQGHQVIFTNERVSSQKHSSGLQTEIDSNPFVYLYQTAKDEYFMGTEGKSLRNLKCTTSTKNVNKNQNPESILEEIAETDCFPINQEACPLDSGIMTHFRAMADHSSLKRSSHMMNENGIDKNGVLDIKGQKRVFPPTPDNNPFNKTKPNNSVILRQDLSNSKPLLEKPSLTDFSGTHLCKTKDNCKIQGEEATITDFILKSSLCQTSNSKESSSPRKLDSPEVVLQSDFASRISSSDCTNRMDHTVVAPITQITVAAKTAKTNETSLSSPPPSASCRRSAHLKSKTSTRANRSESTSIPPKKRGMLKFFTRT